MKFCCLQIGVTIATKKFFHKGYREKGTLLHFGGNVSWWKTIWRFLRKLKMELPYHLAIPILGIYLDKTVIPKR